VLKDWCCTTKGLALANDQVVSGITGLMRTYPNVIMTSAHTFDTVDHKMAEAEFFLAAMADAGPDTFAFRCYLSAYLSASRTTTLALQQFKDIAGFEAWYLPHRKRLRADPVAKYLLNMRNDHVHGGPYPARNGSFCRGEARYFFGGNREEDAFARHDVITVCRRHFVTLLEVVLDCYIRLGTAIDPQQYFTKENFASMGRGILEAECEVWGFERTSLIEEGFDEDARWHELRGHVSECTINHLFYGYLGKVTPQPLEPDEYADFAFTHEEHGWTHVPAGFASMDDYWSAEPDRRPLVG
jgi:hypothetical protein